MRAVHAEAAGRGLPATEDSIEKISSIVLEDVTPRDSWESEQGHSGNISQRCSGKRALTEAVKPAAQKAEQADETHIRKEDIRACADAGEDVGVCGGVSSDTVKSSGDRTSIQNGKKTV